MFTSADTTVVTPNSDTPYSFVWADLRAEPIVITVPQVDPKRYYSVMMVDNNTFNYAIIGTRTTGNGAGNFMIVGPEWQGETPAGIKQVFRSEHGDSRLILFRTQLFNPQDMPDVEKVQAGYQARTLSAFTGKAGAGRGTADRLAGDQSRADAGHASSSTSISSWSSRRRRRRKQPSARSSRASA